MIGYRTQRALQWQAANRSDTVHIGKPFSSETYCGKDRQVVKVWTGREKVTCPVCKLRARPDRTGDYVTTARNTQEWLEVAK